MESSKKKSARVIRNFHGMPWLKRQSPTNNNSQRAVGPDGEVLSMKKTDEDYFPGTRNEKRVKKKKLKKVKNVLTLDTLEDLMSPASASPDSEEKPNPWSHSSNSEENASQMTLPGATVWFKDESTADKLFPNVQSVVIDRNNEEEMMTEALVESIATLQLESFRKPTILEENQWEALHDEDEGGWENVRRNLPSPLKHEASSSNEENKTSPRPGILRNKQDNFRRCFTEPDSLDFGFRSLSESLKEEIKAGRSLKSVTFSKTLCAEVHSGMSSENDGSEKIVDGSKGGEPNIDKYGRVDGYSERRLFMGKGARMKELQYIQSKNNVAAQNNKQLESETLVAMQPSQDVPILEERPTTAVEEPMNSVDNPEKPFTEVETPTTLLENPDVENPEKPITEIENPRFEKEEQPTAEIEIQRLEETGQLTRPKEPEETASSVEIEQAEKTDDQMTEMTKQEPNQPEAAMIPRNETLAIMETLVTPSPVQNVRGPEEEPTTSVDRPRTNELEIPESEEPEIATISENRTHRIMETKVIPPPPVQDICQLTGMTITKVESSQNETNPKRNADCDVHLNIKPGVQDVRYMKKDPTIVVEETDRRRPEKTNIKMWRPEPRKLDKSNKLKTTVENQPEKSRALKDLDSDKNSIKRTNKSNIKAPLWSNSKDSSISLQSKTTASKNMKTKHETACEEPATRFEIVINNRTVQMVSCGTQTEGNCKPGNETSLRDSQKETVPGEKTSEKKTDFVGRCLVPTLVRDDTIKKDSTLDLETLIAMDEMPKPQFQSAAWQNLLLTGALFEDASYEAQNSHINAQFTDLQNQNNFVPNSVSLNRLTIPYQTLDNRMQMPMPNYTPIPPSYLHGNPQTGYDYMLVRVANPPSHNGDSLRSLNNAMYKPMERMEDLERGNNNFAACQLKSEYAVVPGFVKSSQLPPGFTKKEGKAGNEDLSIDSSESNLKNVEYTKDEVRQEEDSPSRSTVDCRGTRKRTNRRRSQKNWTRDVRESETGSDPREKNRKPFSQTRMECQQRQTAWHQKKLAALRKRQNDGPQKDTTEEKSSILEGNSNNDSSNNNYLTKSVNSPVDRRANSPHSEMPVVYQIPNQQPQGIGPDTNWQYYANVMNPAQISLNMIPGYLPSIPNLHTLVPGSYIPMTYQQLQSQLLNPIQAAQNSASDVSPQNVSPFINDQSRSQQYSAVGNHDSNQIPTESVCKAPKGRGRGRRT